MGGGRVCAGGRRHIHWRVNPSSEGMCLVLCREMCNVPSCATLWKTLGWVYSPKCVEQEFSEFRRTKQRSSNSKDSSFGGCA